MAIKQNGTLIENAVRTKTNCLLIIHNYFICVAFVLPSYCLKVKNPTKLMKLDKRCDKPVKFLKNEFFLEERKQKK